MKHVEGHVPLPLEKDCSNCSLFAGSGICSANPAAIIVEWPCCDVTKLAPTAVSGTKRICIFGVETPENVVKSVAWRLTK